jgi:O-antigen/teichoic acid export membrane protein
MKFNYVALVSGLGHTVFLAFSLVALRFNAQNPAFFLLSYAIGMAITNFANYGFSQRFPRARMKPERSEIGTLFQEALPLGISSVMVTVYFYIDTILLRPMKGEAAVGYYNAAYRILVFTIMVPVLFNQVIFPVFSGCFADLKGHFDRLSRIFRRAVLYMGITGIPAALVLFFFSEPLIVLICGDSFLPSARCLVILSLAMVAIFLTYPHTSILVSSGRQILFAWIAGLSGLFNVILNLILIPKYSIEGAAWATVITEVVVLLAALYCVWRFARITALGIELYKIPVMAGAVAFGCYVLKDIHPIVALPVLAVFYVVFLFVLRLLPFDIRDEVRN